jgi:hypothetical protein
MLPGPESRDTFGLSWIRADWLAGDTIADGLTGHGTELRVGATAEPCPERTLERRGVNRVVLTVCRSSL